MSEIPEHAGVSVPCSYLRLLADVDPALREYPAAEAAWNECLLSGTAGALELRGLTKALNKSSSAVDRDSRDQALIQAVRVALGRSITPLPSTLMLFANALSREALKTSEREPYEEAMSALKMWAQLVPPQPLTRAALEKAEYAQVTLLHPGLELEDLVERLRAMVAVCPPGLRVIHGCRERFNSAELADVLITAEEVLASLAPGSSMDGSDSPSGMPADSMGQLLQQLGSGQLSREESLQIIELIDQKLDRASSPDSGHAVDPRQVSTYLTRLREILGPEGLADRAMSHPLADHIGTVHLSKWSSYNDSTLRLLAAFWLAEDLKPGEFKRLGVIFGRQLLEEASALDSIVIARPRPLKLRERGIIVEGLLEGVPWGSLLESDYLNAVAKWSEDGSGNPVSIAFQPTVRNMAVGRLEALGISTVPRLPRFREQLGRISVEAAISVSEVAMFAALVEEARVREIASVQPRDFVDARAHIHTAITRSTDSRDHQQHQMEEFDRWLDSSFALAESSRLLDPLIMSVVAIDGERRSPRSIREIAAGVPKSFLALWMHELSLDTDGELVGGRPPRSAELLWTRLGPVFEWPEGDEGNSLASRRLFVAEAFADSVMSLDAGRVIEAAIERLVQFGITPSGKMYEAMIASLPRTQDRLDRLDDIRNLLSASGESMTAGLWTTFVVGAFGPDEMRDNENFDPPQRIAEGLATLLLATCDLAANATVLRSSDRWFSVGELKSILDCIALVGAPALSRIPFQFLAELDRDARLHSEDYGQDRLRVALRLCVLATDLYPAEQVSSSLRRLWESVAPGLDYPNAVPTAQPRLLETSRWEKFLREIRDAITVERKSDLEDDLAYFEGQPSLLTLGEVANIQGTWAGMIGHELKQTIPGTVQQLIKSDLKFYHDELGNVLEELNQLDIAGHSILEGVVQQLQQLHDDIGLDAERCQAPMDQLTSLYALFSATAIAGERPMPIGSLVEFFLQQSTFGNSVSVDVEGSGSHAASQTVQVPAAVILWSLKVLVSNGLTHGGGTVTIQIRYAQEDEQMPEGAVRLAVLDDGEGLPEMMTRGSSPHRAEPGAKSGLQTTEFALAAAGGRLEVHTVERDRTSHRFHAIVLPLPKESGQAQR